jgi:hypothetical protein
MPPTIATSLKLPTELKAAIDEDARKLGLSSHAYMVRTLADAAERARLREQFTQDALAAERQMHATGMGHSLEAVRQYFVQMAEFRAGLRERPAPLAPRKLM